ncbi:polysaccharide deacetylase family protein [Desulfatitalea alkaliphila]|uniref:Polysaccharide deacetylase family protein n=1 Tax=Desulfatitalea alkaliphila TaxID=2929485 RepID=A0AA41UKI9_9BACT|nr:polysaccharide deacetylase family protein [Desulfatitalea alkaliphila]MCJ8503130.1 polysaccharide deacetylase family protein [Desulfatitalea alkaliphila]
MINLPTIMYHSVGVPDADWIWNHLTIPFDLFEDHIRWLRKYNFNAIDFSEYYRFLHCGDPLPPNPVFLNFDDGYLDNWVFAYPILKKYGFKGTIFINPEFVQPHQVRRPTLEQVWKGELSHQELQTHGFLNWEEMRKMEADGVMDIQSHAMTHTWYFAEPEIVDFRHPGDGYVWMDWNERPDMKWCYLNQDIYKPFLRFGGPVYRHGKSLEVRRFYPESIIAKQLENFVAEQGLGFFDLHNWRNVLRMEAHKVLSKLRTEGRYETDSERRDRLHWELGESKKIIESKLSKQVSFLCWPGGGYDPEAIEISKEYYLGSTVASRDKTGSISRSVDGYVRIERIGCPYIEINGKVRYTDGRYLYHYIKEYQGIKVHRTIRRGLKLLKVLGFI